MQRKIIHIVVLATCFLSFQEIELSKAALKKMNKAITQVWNIETTLEEIDLASDVMESVGFFGYEQISLVGDIEGNSLGYLVISKAKGRYDHFDLMVLYDLDLNIKNTQILAYREDWGGEIGSTRWLKQFVGLSDTDKIQLTYDIQGISGATISCQSATIEFKRLTSGVAKLKSFGELNL